MAARIRQRTRAPPVLFVLKTHERSIDRTARPFIDKLTTHRLRTRRTTPRAHETRRNEQILPATHWRPRLETSNERWTPARTGMEEVNRILGLTERKDKVTPGTTGEQPQQRASAGASAGASRSGNHSGRRRGEGAWPASVVLPVVPALAPCARARPLLRLHLLRLHKSSTERGSFGHRLTSRTFSRSCFYPDTAAAVT